jgi:hypothetical protein
MGSYCSVAPGYFERSYDNFYTHYIAQPITKPHSHSLPDNPPVTHTNPPVAHTLSSSHDLSDADY